MSNEDTPRSNYLAATTDGYLHWRDHARQLERELNAANAEIARLREKLNSENIRLQQEYGDHTLEPFIQDLNA